MRTPATRRAAWRYVRPHGVDAIFTRTLNSATSLTPTPPMQGGGCLPQQPRSVGTVAMTNQGGLTREGPAKRA